TFRSSTTPIEDDLAITLKLTGHPALSITASPATLPVGEEKDVVLRVTNAGNGPASAVSLTLTPAQGSGLSLVRTDNVRALGAIAAGASKTTTVRMRANAAGTPTLGVALAYNDAAGNAAQESRTLYFDTTNVSDAPLSTEILSHSITKGQNGAVVARVKNDGDAELKDVSVVLEPAQGSALALASQAAPTSVASLAPDATLDFTTRLLSTSSQTDVASVVVTVTWTTQDGTTHSRAFEHGLRLWNADLAAVDARLVEDHLDSGRSGNLTFVVTNGESQPLRGVTATLEPSAGATLAYTVKDATDAKRLGDVAPGENATMVTRVLTSNS